MTDRCRVSEELDSYEREQERLEIEHEEAEEAAQKEYKASLKHEIERFKYHPYARFDNGLPLIGEAIANYMAMVKKKRIQATDNTITAHIEWIYECAEARITSLLDYHTTEDFLASVIDELDFQEDLLPILKILNDQEGL